MTVLVLHRGPLAGNPYDRWLADYDGDVLLLAADEQLGMFDDKLSDDGRYRHVEAVSGYDVSGYVESRALELARTHGLRHIVATQERDLERAAQLREILGLPGQRFDSATAFRDKVRMKTLAQAAGVEVAPYAEVECATDVVAFAQRYGYPLVLKPRNGGGSIDLSILDGEEQLAAHPLHSEQPNLIVEAFVPGAMCHVDGLVVDGRLVFAWASQYLYALASYKSDRGARFDVTLDPDDPLSERLLAMIGRVLGAFPGPREFAFHAEVFHTPDDRLVLCEIACRTGGASIREMGRVLFGADPTEWWVRAQVGLPLPALSRRTPARMAGQLVLMKRPGRVVSVPGQPPFPWVRQHRQFVRPGQVMGEAAFSGDFMTSFVVSSPRRQTTEARLRELERWLEANLEIAEPVVA